MSEATTFPWVTLVIFLPLAGAAALLWVGAQQARWIALGVTIADLAIGLPLWWSFDSGSSHMQFTDHVAWIQVPSINYSVGLDGISPPLFLMTTFLTPFCISWLHGPRSQTGCKVSWPCCLSWKRRCSVYLPPWTLCCFISFGKPC